MNPLILAPTSVMETPPLDFLRIAGEVGYDGVGLRLYRSPRLPYHPVLGDAPLIRDMKRTIAEYGLRVVDIFTFYLQPETNVDDFRPALELGAEFGASHAVVQGDDADWPRLRDRFEQICVSAGDLGLTIILEFMPARALATLELAIRLLGETEQRNTAILIDPLHLARSGGTPEDVRRADAKLFPFAQFCDGMLKPGEPDLSLLGQAAMDTGARCLPGEGMLPLRPLLDALPADLPLSIEVLPQPGISVGEARDWASLLLDSTRRYLAESTAGR